MRRVAMLLVLLAASARAETIPVRTGTHPGHGRIVFDVPEPGYGYVVEGEGAEFRLRFGAEDVLLTPLADRPPRNVVALTVDGAEARLVLRAGARARHYRLGNRVVVDVLDPAPAPSRAAAGPTQAAPTELAPVQPEARRAEPYGPQVSASAGSGEPSSAPSPRDARRPVPARTAASTVAADASPPTAPDARRPAQAATSASVARVDESSFAAQPPSSDTGTRRRVPRPDPRGRAAPSAEPPAAVPHGREPSRAVGPRPEVPAGPVVVPVPEPARGAAAVAERAPPVVSEPAPRPGVAPDRDPARSLRAARGEDGPVLHVPAPPGTGLAVFRRGDAIVVIADAALPLDAGGLRGDPVFGGLEVATSAEATVLRLRLAAPATLRARREREGWSLTASHAVPPGRSILVAPERDALLLHAPSPGRAVPVVDADTGLPLLVGTLTEGGAAVPAGLRAPQAEILPTFLGVAVLARGDTPALRAGAERFALLGVSPPVSGGAEAAMTRIFDLPRLDPAAASQRLRALTASIAEAPPLGRLGLRRDAAETLLSLGLGQEAQAMIRLALAEDPRAATDPRVTALNAAAALIAGRIAEAAPLLEAAGSDEAALWAGLARAAREEGGAPALAATLPMLLSYPEPLRARLLPDAAEALIAGNERGAARRLLDARPDDPSLAFARARLAEAEGRTDAALDGFARLAEGRDRLLRARAIRAGVELRLATGTLDAAGAAAALESALFAWRGDAREAETRLRLAELRRLAGDPRAAMALLAETAVVFPDRAEAVRRGQEEALLALLAREAPLPAVALVEAHADLLPRDGRGAEALLDLAGRLAALDLPARAAALARRALDRGDASARPRGGAALADHLLAAGEAREAMAALAATDSAAMPEELRVRRRLLSAHAYAAGGDPDAAIAALRDLGPAGRRPLADLLADRRDWGGAADALAGVAEEADADPRLAVRAAAYAALAGDPARSAVLRARWAGRLGTGPVADAFDLLTADPAGGLAALPRLPRELDLFRAIPRGLEAFRTAATVSR